MARVYQCHAAAGSTPHHLFLLVMICVLSVVFLDVRSEQLEAKWSGGSAQLLFLQNKI